MSRDHALWQALVVEPAAEVDRIVSWMRDTITQFRRRGVVVGISGGVDSAVTAALAVRAVGAGNTLGLFMPDEESDASSLGLGELVAKQHGIATVTEDITDTLRAIGCFRRRDEALRAVIPDYGPGWRFKVVLPPLVGTDRYRISSVVAQPPDGPERRVRLPPQQYRAIIAATSFKQRTRKMVEFFHADAHHYVVAGTPNRLEYDQGFFVKNGDGAADIKPIAHLYKTQVYQLAEFLGVPSEIAGRPPTTDTYSLPQSQEEFFFSVPYDTLDLCVFALDTGVAVDRVADAVDLTAQDVRRIFDDIQQKRELARYLHASAATLPRAVASGDGMAESAATR